MPNNLQHVATSASEDKQITSVRIAAKRFLDLERQAIHTSPHIRPPNRQPDPGTRWNRNHDRTSALTIAFAKSGDTEIGIRTWPPLPTITSIVGSGAVVTAGRPAATTTWANPTAVVINSFRHR